MQTEELSCPITIISYTDLKAFDPLNPDQGLIDSIGNAFGPGCLGIMAVTGVPDFMEKRAKLLPLSAKIPHLPDLQDCVSPQTHYSIGWSHGKEEIEPGKPDMAKGSFYGNPRTDDTLSRIDPQLAEQRPDLYCDNIWPKSLPELRDAFCDMGETIVQVGVLIARVCDAYCKTQGVHTNLGKILSESMNTKGRLLHYFPMKNESGEMWCAWHNDHVSSQYSIRCSEMFLFYRSTVCWNTAFENFSILFCIIGLTHRPRPWNVS